ncbi:DUF4331 family protein [Actinomadura sp. 9N407]|uniref:DUF4331 family protein n=1 Tax=Actinomadura sp. 9N407 TaxID=3375154 RepID=UPI0037907496
MSHHLDSPASRRDPRLNVTDVYVFDGQDATVMAMIVNTSLAGAGRTPGLHPEGRYEFKIHLDGSATEQLTYRFSFGPVGPTGTQQVAIDRLTGADDAAGTRITEGTTGQVVTGSGVRSWTGAALDPFYLDLRHLAHILDGLQNEKPIDNGEWSPEQAASSFTGSQICAIVLEIGHGDGELRPGRRIGVWGRALLATDAGGWRQVNRAGIPMVWPLFRALGGDDDSAEYRRDTIAQPADDPANDAGRIAAFVAAAVRRTGIGNPEGYGRAVAAWILPDILPYEVGTPAAFSFAGFNGRGLADNAPEVIYGLITNSAIPTGLVAESAAETRQEGFPFVVPA